MIQACSLRRMCLLVEGCGNGMGRLAPSFCADFALPILILGSVLLLPSFEPTEIVGWYHALIMGSFARPFFWLLILSESFSPSCCSILLLLKLGSAHGSLGWTYCSTSCLSSTFRPLVQTAVCPATCLLPSLLLLHLLLYNLMAVRCRSWLSLQDAASL